MDQKIILIKFGGSAITDKKVPYKANIGVIKRLAKELRMVKKHKIILGHGVGSFAHTSAQKYGGIRGYKSKGGIAKVARDAMEINRIVMDVLIEEGLPAVSLRPMSMVLAKNGTMDKHFFDVVEEVLQQKLIPVISGDVIWDKVWKSTIHSGEVVLNNIAVYLIDRGFRIDKIIQVGQTNGMYNDKGKSIPFINKVNWPKLRKYILKGRGADVTGGMMHKIESSLVMADKGIKTLLISGNIDNELSNALLGKPVQGTIIEKN